MVRKANISAVSSPGRRACRASPRPRRRRDAGRRHDRGSLARAAEREIIRRIGEVPCGRGAVRVGVGGGQGVGAFVGLRRICPSNPRGAAPRFSPPPRASSSKSAVRTRRSRRRRRTAASSISARCAAESVTSARSSREGSTGVGAGSTDVSEGASVAVSETRVCFCSIATRQRRSRREQELGERPGRASYVACLASRPAIWSRLVSSNARVSFQSGAQRKQTSTTLAARAVAAADASRVNVIAIFGSHSNGNGSVLPIGNASPHAWHATAARARLTSSRSQHSQQCAVRRSEGRAASSRARDVVSFGSRRKRAAPVPSSARRSVTMACGARVGRFPMRCGHRMTAASLASVSRTNSGWVSKNHQLSPRRDNVPWLPSRSRSYTRAPDASSGAAITRGHSARMRRRRISPRDRAPAPSPRAQPPPPSPAPASRATEANEPRHPRGVPCLSGRTTTSTGRPEGTARRAGATRARPRRTSPRRRPSATRGLRRGRPHLMWTFSERNGIETERTLNVNERNLLKTRDGTCRSIIK